jgi:hypothetical protein
VSEYDDLAGHMRAEHGYPKPELWRPATLSALHEYETALLDLGVLKWLDDMKPHAHD